MSVNAVLKEPSIYAGLFHIDKDFGPERQLWIAVISQALVDAASPDERPSVGDWLDTDDSEAVFHLAGMREEFIRPIFMSIIETRNRKRAFRKAMSAKFMLRSYIEEHLPEKSSTS